MLTISPSTGIASQGRIHAWWEHGARDPIQIDRTQYCLRSFTMDTNASFSIRHAEPTDAPGIADVYNEAILHTTATFDTEPKSVDDRTEWLQSHDDRHPVLVAVSDGRVVGGQR